MRLLQKSLGSGVICQFYWSLDSERDLKTQMADMCFCASLLHGLKLLIEEIRHDEEVEHSQ
jgi:hypothetical protein